MTTRQQNFRQGIVIFVLVLLLSWPFGESMIGGVLANWALDRFIRWEQRIKEQKIVLVDITEDDYIKIFQRRRPLDSEKIGELINAANNGGAEVIAVDIHTADWIESEKLMSELPKARIVWARYFYQDYGNRPRQRMEQLLGGVASAAGECYGLPALGRTAGVVRYFYTRVKVDNSEPSFVGQILHRRDHDSCLEAGDSDEKLRIISFAADIPRESASTLLLASKQTGWRQRAEYKDKIVMIGGSFHGGTDIDLTPVGPRSGLEVMGQALSSALTGRAKGEVGKGVSLLIDVTVGGFMLFIIGQMSRILQVISTVVLAVLVGAVCLYWFRQYYLFVDFVPFVLGIVAHAVLGWMHERR